MPADPNPRPGVDWQLQTAPPLTVDDVYPGPQALVSDYWSGVRLTFSHPVVAGTVPPRFSLVDGAGQSVPGQVRWEAGGATFVYQPDEPLRPEAAYHFELQAGVRDELGFRLAQPLALDFTTLGLVGLPQPVPGTEGVTLDSQVRIPFARPMDHASVEAGLAFTPTLAGEITWEGDTLVLTPLDGLAGDTTYTVRLGPEVLDASGVPLSESKEWPFSTEPLLLDWEVPSGTAVRRLQQPLTLTFALPMDAASLADSLSISPPTPGDLIVSDEGRQAAFRPRPGWLSGADYEVVLGAAARTAGGGQSLGQDRTWQFATAPVEVDFGQGPAVQVLDAGGPRAFQVMVSGGDVADFGLSPITRTQFLEMYGPGLGLDLDPVAPLLVPTTGLTATVQWREVMVPLDGEPILARSSVAEGHLPADVLPGFYLLSSGADGGADAGDGASHHLLLVLTRPALVLKQALADGGAESRSRVVAWDTELSGGAPVVSATVQLYDGQGNALAQGVTGADGLLTLEVPGDPGPVLALSDAGGDLTVCGLDGGWVEGDWLWWTPPASRPPYTTYSYTDRPIYRPGQQIYFKDWIRADDDAVYSLPAPDLPVTVRLRDARDNVAASRVLTPSAFGTISGTFQLADEPMLGTWYLETDVAGALSRVPLQVEAYRKPAFEVTVGTPQESYVQGETISVTVTAAYYAGRPAADAAVTLAVYPAYAGEAYDRAGPWFGAAVRSEEGRTDEQGHWTVALPGDVLFDPAAEGQRLLLALEATVDDGSGQTVSSYRLVTLYPAARGLSLLLEQQGYEPGQKITFGVRLLDLDGRPVSGAQLRARVLGWDDAEVAVGLTTTDEDGLGHFSVTLAQQGWYRLLVTADDGSGREVTAGEWLWVYDPLGVAPWYGGRQGRGAGLGVTLDRATYAVGDVAQLAIQTPLAGPALLTLERGETRQAQPISLISGTNLITLPVRADYAPTVHVVVSQYGPPDPELWGYQQSWPDAELHTAEAQLLVPQAGRRLTVTLETDRETYAPGDEAEVRLHVVDAQGQPVTAEVSLAVVDEAIYALAEDVSADPFQAFYAPRPDTVLTFDSLGPSRWFFEFGGVGGGDGQVAGAPRRDFLDTAYWAPALVTDENGEAVVRLTLPDDVTEWRLLARAVTTDTLVGQATARLVTSQELVLRPALPRFLMAGDALTVTAQVQNFTSQPVSATVTVELAGLTLAAGAETPARVVTVPAGGSALVGWPAVVDRPLGPLPLDREQARVSFGATATRGGTLLAGRDAVEVTLPIYLPAERQVTTFAGELTSAVPSQTLTLTVPVDAVQGLSRLQVELAPSLAPGLLDGVEYLVDYPHGCVEQTMSRVLPNAVVGRAFRELGRSSPLLETDLPPMVELGLQMLYGYQHDDGGWGWWYDDDTDLNQTAYVLLGLALTEQAGFDVDQDVVERGSQWLRGALPDAEPEAQAYGAYVLATAGQPLSLTLSVTEALSLDPFSQAALALALGTSGEEPEAVGRLLDELGAAAVHEGATTYWRNGAAGDAVGSGPTMGSDVRTTALVVLALSRLDPEFAAPVPGAAAGAEPQERPLLPRAVRWLMARRQGAGWGDTQRTSYALLALSDYLLLATQSAAGGGYQVYVGPDLWAEGELAPDAGGRTLVLTYSLGLSPSLLLPGENPVRLVLDGGGTAPGGRLYYAAAWQAQRPAAADEMAALAPHERSIALTRTYRLADGGEALTTFQRGDLVEVELALDVPAESWYVAVEDSLPAGLEALNERLGTTSHTAAAYQVPVYDWQELGYNRKDVRDEGVTFFISYLAPGRHVLRYLARAVTGGEFAAMPARAYLMYEPEVWSRSAG
ncbi:MAG: Ig-like domain-containing protein, partial [Anaerolineae bacterium]